jgi:hypothetical protein
MNRKLENLIWNRANRCCEYCGTPQDYEVLPAEIDHIIAEVHGGQTVSGNLALSCYWCNRYKGPNLAGIDPQTKKHTRLFHPRRHSWMFHFCWKQGWLFGKTPIGRTTIRVLKINSPLRVALRQELTLAGFMIADD